MFARGSLLTFIFHCYWEGEHPNVYMCICDEISYIYIYMDLSMWTSSRPLPSYWILTGKQVVQVGTETSYPDAAQVGSRCQNQNNIQWYIDRLDATSFYFHTYVPGRYVCWISTPFHPGPATSALRGMLEFCSKWCCWGCMEGGKIHEARGEEGWNGGVGKECTNIESHPQESIFQGIIFWNQMSEFWWMKI